MELLVTEFQKGRAKFEKLFQEHRKGNVINPAGFETTFDKAMVEEILSTGSCKFLNTLNEIGVHLMKSFHTRSTGHKQNDFSTLQSHSAPELELLYAAVPRAWTKIKLQQNKQATGAPEMVPITDAAVDPEFFKKLMPIQKKLNKARKDLLSLIKSDNIMYDNVKEEYEAIEKGKTPPEGVVKTYNDMAKKLNSTGVQYVDQKSQKIVDEIKNFSDAMLMYGSAVFGAAAMESGILSLECAAFLLAGLEITADVVIATVAPVGVGAGIFALLGLAALALHVATETGVVKRLGRIKAKRFEIKINEHLTSVLKYTNEASKVAETYVRKRLGKQENEKVALTEVPDEIRKIVKNFVQTQHDRWVKYTTATGREYFEEFKAAHGKHWSGLRKVRDTKQDNEWNSAKLAYANMWANMGCAV